MSPLVVLPYPLESGSIALGQLITDPVYADSSSFTPSSQPSHNSNPEQKFQTTVAHDPYGRRLRTTSDRSHLSRDTLLNLKAELALLSSIAKPRSAFDTLRQDIAARAFFHNAALQRQPVYYVASIQTLKNPSFQHPGVAEATAMPIRLPTHVRRADSVTSLAHPDTKSANENAESIFAVELIKVKCRVSDASEPHSVEDLEYQWSYHKLDNDLQLCIGFGEPLDSAELRTIAGVVADEEFTDASWDSQLSDDEGGIGGF